MHALGFTIPNQKLVNAFGKGILGAVGSVLVYATVIALVFLWYRVACKRSGTCVSSVIHNLADVQRQSEVAPAPAATASSAQVAWQ